MLPGVLSALCTTQRGQEPPNLENGKEAPAKDAARANVGAYEHAMGKTFPKQAVDALVGGFEKAI